VRRRIVLLLAIEVVIPGAVVLAQNSVYGVQGVGFPGRPVSVRSRGLAGGDAVFDSLSAVNPATAALHPGVTASMSAATVVRRYAAFDTTVTGLLETRVPFMAVGGQITGTPLSFSVSSAPYLERTFDIRTTDTLVLRGDSVTVSDRVSSDGGMSDLRGALAMRLRRGIWVGVAGHLLAGSSKLRVQREFSDTQYRSFGQQSDLTFTGGGLSVGAMVQPASGLQFAASLRSDTRLRTTQERFAPASADLPMTVTAGLWLRPARGVVWSSTAVWRSWSGAAADLVGNVTAFDTWDLASGIELGRGTQRIPLRLGVRYATLPFSGRAEQAHDVTLAAGSGISFARRVFVDVAVERALRSGAGAEERLWQFAVGLSVVP
jgi:hypothetical protein